MVKIAFVVYRKWGYDIFKKILKYQKSKNNFVVTTLIVPQNYNFIIDRKIKNQISVSSVDPTDMSRLQSILKKNNIDIACFYSWSWIVNKAIFENITCLCLHPSPLPKYRGGTPIQHQLIRGEKTSAVTIFKINEGIDAGDIYMQAPISLLGTINDIFNRMIDIGTSITKHLIDDAINNELYFSPQKNLVKYPPLKRRNPDQSEITIEGLKKITYIEFYNLVRGLLKPYPNVFMQLSNFFVTVQAIQKHKKIDENCYIINEKTTKKDLLKYKKNAFVKLLDSFAQLSQYKIKKK